MGKINYQRSVQFADYLAVACTDNTIRFIKLDKINNHRSKKKFKPYQHELTRVILDKDKNVITIPEDIMCTCSKFQLGKDSYSLCVMSLLKQDKEMDFVDESDIETGSEEKVYF